MNNVVAGPGFGRGPLESGGGGGHDGGMSDLVARVGRLEKDVADIRSVLGRMEPALARIDDQFRKQSDNLNEIKGRAQAMPTMWQLLLMVLAVIGVIGIFATFTVNRVDRLEAKVERVLERLPPRQ